MRGIRFMLAAAALAGCTAVGGEQFSHVASPSTLAAVPHDPAERSRFETFHGPATAPERVRALWRDRFLTAGLNRAFAVSAHHAGVTSNFSTADAAVAGAVRACERSGEPCVPYAVNTEIVYPGAADTLPFRGRALGPFTPSPEYIYHGPAAAKGVIVWSHGTDKACAANGARFGAPPLIGAFNRDGWDVVRFDRDPCADDLDAALRRMPAGIAAAHQAGYRRVVLAGQSRGAMQSFEVLRDPAVAAAVSGAIGFSPAMSGNDVLASTLGPQRWAAAASRLTGSMPAAVFFFGQDPFNPYARQQAEQTDTTWRSQLPNGHAFFDDAPGLLGHGAAVGQAFTAKYARCLLTLIDRGTAEDACPPSSAPLPKERPQ